MRIAVYGRGNVGGGLGDLWERAGHQVTRLGRDGGDVSAVEAVLLAVPGGAVADALGKVRGIEGKTVIDATNIVGTKPPDGYPSNAEYVKSRTNGPTAKSFNVNFAVLFSRLGEARVTPGNLWCGDEEACEVVERLNRDAGYEPIYACPLDNKDARAIGETEQRIYGLTAPHCHHQRLERDRREYPHLGTRLLPVMTHRAGGSAIGRRRGHRPGSHGPTSAGQRQGPHLRVGWRAAEGRCPRRFGGLRVARGWAGPRAVA